MAASTAMTRRSPKRRPGRAGRRCRDGRVTCVEGDHVGSGLRVGRLGVAETLVGWVANGPEGIPILGVDAAADPEVAGVAHHRSVRSARCSLKYCLILEDL